MVPSIPGPLFARLTVCSAVIGSGMEASGGVLTALVIVAVGVAVGLLAASWTQTKYLGFDVQLTKLAGASGRRPMFLGMVLLTRGTI